MKKWIMAIIAAIIAIGVSFIVWSNYMLNQGAKPIADGSNEYAILLGAKVEKNGEPSLTLLYRLQEAEKYLKENAHVTIVVSGGQGGSEPISEAEAMYNYLVEAGIEEDRIIQEDKATSTYENLLYSIELLPDNTKNVTIITSDFHCARAKMLAEKLGLEADFVEAKTPKIVEQKLRFRERLALVKSVVFDN